MRSLLFLIALALFPSTSVFATVPSSFITRAAAVYRLIESDPALRARATEFRSHMPPLPLFHDVPQTSALAPYLEVAFEAGIITGNRERLFRPYSLLSATPHSSSIPTLPAYPSDLFAMSIPTLGIDRLPVSHPVDPTTQAGILEPLKSGVGHLFGFPGGGGKVFVYGHSSGYPWDLSVYTRIFRTVNRLAVGDPIEIVYQGQRFVYRVTNKERILANDLRLFQEDGEEEELILYTCWPPDSVSERLLVRARPVVTLSGR